jgi:hypothetical protein
MTTSSQIAKHFREVYFGGNWTCSNLKDNLKDVTWQQATTKLNHLNSIATLTYHIYYYVKTLSGVLKGGILDSKDELSFNHPPINSQADWEHFTNQVFADVEEAVGLIEQLPDNKLMENFTDAKYGNYYRNIHGIIEHTHYHLGQIAMIRKISASVENDMTTNRRP